MKILRNFALVAAVCATAATAAAQAPLYFTGDCSTNVWSVTEPDEFAYADGVYTLNLTGAIQGQQFKISTAKGSWDDFNANCYGIAEDNTTYRLNLNKVETITMGKLGNFLIPASGDFVLTVDLANSCILLSGEGTYTDVFDIYVRGDINSWGVDEAYKFAYVESNENNEQVYRLLLPNGIAGEFKIADANWSTVNYGSPVEITLGTTTEVYHNGANLSANITNATMLTFYHNLDNSKSSWLKVDNYDGVSDIIADTDAPVEYYNLQGVRVDHPAAGNIYIRVQGSKACKVRK